MNIQIICVGKLKEKYWVEALLEYKKRLSRYCKISIVEVKEELISENPSPATEEIVKDEEGKRIIGKLKQGAYIISLDIKGEELNSLDLAHKLNHLGVSGRSDVVFIIGGSLGLSKAVLEKSHMRLSFSKMTYPHQMMRIILLEQIYRGFKINRNESYHK
jgi:23S rRNA (pseudouridine1915-N3)-methyltransferase